MAEEKTIKCKELYELNQINYMEDLKKLETELKIKMLSPQTVKSYLYWNEQFLNFVKKLPEDVGEDDIKSFIAAKISNSTPKTIALIIAALRFFYDGVLKKNIVNLKTPKIPKEIPIVLTREEVKKLIESVENKKHKLIIELLYSSGLRVGEVVNLRVGDLELEEGIGWIRRGKGKKDRKFFLAKLISRELETFIRETEKKPTDYLFSSSSINGKMSVRNVQKIVKLIAERAKIDKNVHPHTLRHSYGTHLLDAGVNLRQIQELLGHEKIATTEIYTHISTENLKKIKNPLDDLFS